jgi:hypothetical protein
VSSHRKYAPSWVPDPHHHPDSPRDVRDRLDDQQEFNNKVVGAQGGTACDEIDEMIRLPIRGIFVGKLSELAYHDPKYPKVDAYDSKLRNRLSFRGGLFDPECRASWRTAEGFTTTVHTVCGAGDMIYILDVSDSPSVLHKLDNSSECIFKGLAWTRQSVDTNTAVAKNYPRGQGYWSHAEETTACTIQTFQPVR